MAARALRGAVNQRCLFVDTWIRSKTPEHAANSKLNGAGRPSRVQLVDDSGACARRAGRLKSQPVQGHVQDLFEPAPPGGREQLAPGAWLLRGFALEVAPALAAAVEYIEAAAPFRHWETPGGFRMSVAMTNCGSLGWTSHRRGYRYERCDPLSGEPWPPMPGVFAELARAAADLGGFPGFVPDACLLNLYQPGARLSLHQDKDERDLLAPVVSVSLGLPAIFLFGGETRAEWQRRIALCHGDVVVWGGAARLRHHGVLPIKDGHHETWGARRLNLTFRRAS
ncbi:MAG: Alkylated repair protein alkB [Gammaproteobacteria bacterium]|nr:Alkylated repair protein alkB [Gammaproteobacteria bacterium]